MVLHPIQPFVVVIVWAVYLGPASTTSTLMRWKRHVRPAITFWWVSARLMVIIMLLFLLCKIIHIYIRPSVAFCLGTLRIMNENKMHNYYWRRIAWAYELLQRKATEWMNDCGGIWHFVAFTVYEWRVGGRSDESIPSIDSICILWRRCDVSFDRRTKSLCLPVSKIEPSIIPHSLKVDNV